MSVRQFIKVDEDGFEIEPVLVEVDDDGNPREQSDYLVPTDQGGFWKKRWDFKNRTWTEGATTEEIACMRKSVALPSAEERLVALENALLSLMLER